MSFARTNIEAEAWGDLRFATLARLCGLADADHALIKCAKIWSWQTENFSPEAPTYVVDRDTIDTILGDRGSEHIVRAKLGEDTPDGIRIKGGIDSKGKCRISWLYFARVNGARGSEMAKRKRDNDRVPGGSATLRERELDNNRVPGGSGGGPGTLDHPLAHPLTPLSSSLSDQRSQISLSGSARAIPPSAVPGPMPEPAPPTPSSIGDHELRARAWAYQLERFEAVQRDGIWPNASPLAPRIAGEHDRNMRACIANLRASGYDEPAVEAKLRNAVDVAEAEARRIGKLEWFKPSLLWDPRRFARTVDTTPAEAGRVRDGPKPSAPTSRASPATRSVREILNDRLKPNPDEESKP